MKVRKFFLITIAIIGTVSYYTAGVRREPVEKLAISSSLGYDLREDAGGVKIRSVAVSQYVLTEDKKSSRTIVTEGKTVPETRETRQTKLDKRYLLGLEKVVIIGEEYARFGITDIIDGFFRNADVRDAALLCVCKGRAEDIMKIKIEGYPSSGDFIEGLIKFSSEFNFFPENYKLIDAYVRLDAEGRNLVIPYIEVEEDSIRISGLALFKGDKMVNIIPMRQVKIHNLLRENSINGTLTIEENPKKYINVFGKSKRKVKCYKEDNRYMFVINIEIRGDIVANEYEHSLISKPEKRKEVEGLLKNKLEKEAKEFLSDVRSEHKVDCLELGRIAAAKYGRETGVDWNELVANSDIDVNVTIKIDRQGRGDY
jgi:Ger(x)C family germination protein